MREETFMSTTIPADFEPFVQDVIRREGYQSADDVVAEALRIYREIDRRRAELRTEIEAGIASESIAGEIAFAELDRLAKLYSMPS